MMKECCSFTINFDHWSCFDLHKFISVFLYFLNEDFEPQTINLSTFIVEGGNHEFIKKDITDVLNEFGLLNENLNKIYSIFS